jgi:tetratricopeptide (TPR) repeat protein
VRRFNCIDTASYHAAVDDGLRVTVETPQLSPAECWNYLCYWGPSKEVYAPNPNPHLTEWHKHNPPPGTAYNPLPRFDHRSLVERPDVGKRIAAMHALAPYDHVISFNFIRMGYAGQKNESNYDRCQEVYKLVLPYATYAMAAVADAVKDQPGAYEALMSKAAVIEPARYFYLGSYFQERHMDDKAAGYFEKGNDLTSNSVGASHHAPWLVKYYLDKGEIQKAQRVADEAGEVYSSPGLEAKAEFLEATGKYAEAFEWYAKIEERYEKSGPLIEFCGRYKAKTGDTRFDAELKNRTAKLFPKGLEKVSLKDFQSTPTDGVLVREENDLLRKAGMKLADVIVAVNGLRVHNFPQYNYGRSADMTSEMTLIIWQANQYREVVANPPDHRFGVKMGDYRQK